MNILFYIEPVIYQNDALFLSPHLNFVRCFIQANLSANVRYGLATSPWLIKDYNNWVANHGGSTDISFYSLNPTQYLRPFNFETQRYSVDVHIKNENNEFLKSDLIGVKEKFNPDVVICSTENIYIRKIFSSSIILHHDLSHIRRKDNVYNLFFDTCGHTKNSILNLRSRDIIGSSISEKTVNDVINSHDTAIFEGDDVLSQQRELAQWADSESIDLQKTAIIALQHSKNIVVEGAINGKSCDSILMGVADKLPNGWLGIVTYHPADREISKVAPYIVSTFPNLVTLPDRLSEKRSDAIIPKVGAVISVNSKVGLLALLTGVKTISLGYSAYSAYCSDDVSRLDEAPILSKQDRAKLIKFMSNKYYFTFNEIFTQNGFMLEQISGMQAAESPQAWQLDDSEWDISRLERLY